MKMCTDDEKKVSIGSARKVPQYCQQPEKYYRDI